MKLGWPFIVLISAESVFIGLTIGSISVTGVDPASAPHGAIEYVTHRYQAYFAAAFALVSAWIGVAAIRSQMLHADMLNTRILFAEKSNEMNTLYHLRHVADAHVRYTDDFNYEAEQPLVDDPLRDRVARYCNPNVIFALSKMMDAKRELHVRKLMLDNAPVYARLLNNSAIFCRDVAADQLESLERITGTKLVPHPPTPSHS